MKRAFAPSRTLWAGHHQAQCVALVSHDHVPLAFLSLVKDLAHRKKTVSCAHFVPKGCAQSVGTVGTLCPNGYVPFHALKRHFFSVPTLCPNLGKMPTLCPFCAQKLCDLEKIQRSDMRQLRGVRKFLGASSVSSVTM